MSRVPPPEPVTVIGLGDMGSVLAAAFLASGHRVTVWNRTKSRAERMSAKGATIARTPSDALASSSLGVICLRDHAAWQDVIAAVDRDLLPGLTIVQLSSTTAEEAMQTASWASARGASYLDGVILNTPSAIGVDATICLAGERPAYGRHYSTLAALGRIIFVGAEPEKAARLDACLLTFCYAAFAGFIQGAALAIRTAVDLADYEKAAKAMLETTVVTTGSDAIRQISSMDFCSGDVTLEIAAAPVTGYVRDANCAAGLATDLPEAVAAYFERAVAAGFSGHQQAIIYDVIMHPSDSATASGEHDPAW